MVLPMRLLHWPTVVMDGVVILFVIEFFGRLQDKLFGGRTYHSSLLFLKINMYQPEIKF